MYCWNCGKNLERGTKFCPSCGAAVESKVGLEDVKEYTKEKLEKTKEFAREKAPIVKEYVQEKSTAVSEFVKEKTPVVKEYVQEKSMAVSTYIKGNSNMTVGNKEEWSGQTTESGEGGMAVIPEEERNRQPSVNTYEQNREYVRPVKNYNPALDYTPIGMWGYFGYRLLFMIPFVGFLVALVLAVGGGSNINVRNFARSWFCIDIIVLVIEILALIGGISLWM